MSERLCPNCKTPLERKYPRRMIFECGKCGNSYKIVIKRKKRSSFNPNDSSTWKATCAECGGIMDYYNFKYGCRDCGNVLEV